MIHVLAVPARNTRSAAADNSCESLKNSVDFVRRMHIIIYNTLRRRVDSLGESEKDIFGMVAETSDVL